MLERIKVWRPAGLGDLELRRGADVTEPYPRHWHEEYQLCLITAGDGGELVYRGSRHATPTDSLFIVHPGEVHANNPGCDMGCSFRSIYIPPDTLRHIASGLARHRWGFPFFHHPMVFDKDILDLYLDLHHSISEVGYA